MSPVWRGRSPRKPRQGFLSPDFPPASEALSLPPRAASPASGRKGGTQASVRLCGQAPGPFALPHRAACSPATPAGRSPHLASGCVLTLSRDLCPRGAPAGVWGCRVSFGADGRWEEGPGAGEKGLAALSSQFLPRASVSPPSSHSLVPTSPQLLSTPVK